MKPCPKNRKLIAWLALGALELAEASRLQAHLEGCPGCRRYLEEIAQVTTRLNAAATTSELPATGSFHLRVARALRAEQGHSAWPSMAAWPRWAVAHWRVAVPIGAAAAVMLLLVSFIMRPPARSLLAPTAVPARAAPQAKNDLAPSVSNYQMVANRSLEKLDELLSSQANRNASPAPIYTASSFSRATEAD